MVKVETLKEDGFVRILRCREDNRICLGTFCKNGPGWLICLGSFCVSMCGCGMPLNAKASKVVVLKGGYGYVKFNI